MLIVSVFPSAMLIAQPNKSNLKNVVFLIDVARTLRSSNLMTQATYEEVMRLIAERKITRRSALLDQLGQEAGRWFKQTFGSQIFRASIEFDVQEPNEEQLAELIKLLHQLKESSVVNQHVNELLHADIIANRIGRLDIQLFNRAAARMKVYEWIESHI